MDPVDRFRDLLRIPTVHPEAGGDWAEHERFVARLAELYPALHAALERERVDRSVLFRWRGASAERPTVLMAHYDVVPAAGAEGWTHPPFAADLDAAGVIWGRGTIDDKGELVAILEAVETLVGEGFVPANDVYLSFGHDEESHGTGARAIVDELERRGIRPALVVDEGGAVVDDVFPGVDRPIAAIGVSEKGIANVLLTVEQDGGHASTPPAMAATVRIARAVERLERHPFPARLDPPVRAMLAGIGPHARGVQGWAFRHLGLTAGLVTRLMARMGPETRAMVRTTMAVTQLGGSAAANVLAERATATVNVRIATSSSLAAVGARVRRVIDDPLVRVELVHTTEPSPVSPAAGPAWDAVRGAVEAAFPDAVPVPYVMFAASDARQFTRISDHVYRFCGMRMTRAERAGLHAIDERVRVSSWLETIAFYTALVRAV
ncbi:M20/M25/M40 family metallo-hydrolase [Galbitalea sp. SE-J8]|uniref:M20/M25/M40 family metallo-hydrolase n=1 Tax=Galbitalea sp. SE-J8 TaxID=3054952 RepID=UPI00259CABCA|nr:M20/M25/M40 family metallo-hydrolase [Galbitalea sp. SE-J8]MDM4762624.1 M20/M25/M40 family metallo-hydrolase [Galbitalea sp. SE-J8]